MPNSFYPDFIHIVSRIEPGKILDGIITKYVVAFISLIAGFLFRSISFKAFRERYLKLFLNYKKGEVVYIIVGSHSHKSNTNIEYAAQSVPIMALVYSLARKVKELYKGKVRVKIVFNHNNINEYSHENIIAIGGPATNDMVREILKHNEFRFHPYHDEIEAIKNGSNGTPSKRSFIDSRQAAYGIKKVDSQITDYGLIVKTPNLNSKRKTAVLLYGIETFGTCAAMLSLIHMSELIKKCPFTLFERKKVCKSSTMEALVEIDAFGYSYNEQVNIIDFRYGSSSLLERNNPGGKKPSVYVEKYWE